MTSSDSTHATLIEHLPAEIFLQIFTFFSLSEIVTAFSGLNSYINSLIRSVREVSLVVKYNDTDAVNLLKSFSTQICRLVIFNVEETDFTSLVNLRSLTLKYGTQAQFNAIRPQHFPLLEIFHVTGFRRNMVKSKESLNDLLQILLSNGFPRLRICMMFGIGVVSFSDTWTGSPTLRALNLYIKKSLDCERLRFICPRVRRLTTRMFPMEELSRVIITIAGGNGYGTELNQLFGPWGITIDDDDQTLFIADQGNHRIVAWRSNAARGQIVAGGNGRGNQTNQFHWPTEVIVDQKNHALIIADLGNRRVVQWSRQNRTVHGKILLSDIHCYGLTMDKKGSLYVSDTEKNEVKRWKRGENEGTIVAGGNGAGDQLNQLRFPTFLFVDGDESLYVSDNDNHRVMKWTKDAKEGIVVAGGNGKGHSLRQLSSPRGVLVDPFGQIYVADKDNDRVMRWREGAREGTLVAGGNEQGQEANQLNSPMGLSFDRVGNLYVADYNNHRIRKFVVE